jgi:hypothetical protein
VEPVNQITHRAAANESKGKGKPNRLFLHPVVEDEQNRKGDKGDSNEKNLTHHTWLTGKQTKCRPGIVQIGKVKEPPNHHL